MARLLQQPPATRQPRRQTTHQQVQPTYWLSTPRLYWLQLAAPARLRPATQKPGPMTLPHKDREAVAAPAFVLRGALITDGGYTAGSVVAVKDGRIAYAGPASGFDVAQFPGAEDLP